MDTTFKVVPKQLRPYKLLILILVGLPKILAFHIILCFIFRFLDNVVYKKLFNYLNDNFNFKPSIIHTYFEISITNQYNK